MARLMRRQEGAIGGAQLRELGFSDTEVRRLVAGGALRPRYRGVFVDGRAPIPARGQLFAALLTLGETAFLSHRSAAALHGLRPINTRLIELTVVANHTPRHNGLKVHRTSTPPHPSEIRIKDGLRVSSVPRLLKELAGSEPRRELDRLIAEAARRRLLNLDEVAAATARHPRHAGAATLRAALHAYRPAPADKSGLEKAFAAWLATHPEIPPPDRNVSLGPWEIDCLWPEHRLAVELDGRPYHLTPAELERDRVKDVWLQRQRIHAMRVTEFRFEHDKPGVLDDLLDLLGMAAPRG